VVEVVRVDSNCAVGDAQEVERGQGSQKGTIATQLGVGEVRIDLVWFERRAKERHWL